MDIEQMKRIKRELGYTNEMIAEKSGVPLGTVQKIFGGATSAPRAATIERLSSMLEREAQRQNTTRLVREDAVIYKATTLEEDNKYPRQGSYTVQDVLSWPENDPRVELIDGVIYDMASPTIGHQDALGEIYHQMKSQKKSTKSRCRPFMAPLDVRLDRDERTLVQPDVFIICGDEEKIKERIDGEPDFVCEILSPTTRQKDMIIKLNKYKNAGCREYWIVDLARETVLVYDFDSDEYPVQYTFDDVVPIAISGGKWQIDFREVKNEITVL